ncbi:MAG: insulinase family protein [Chloroflexi bacterium]|nr:insulinase family protein [Chloroflexota bacterium]
MAQSVNVTHGAAEIAGDFQLAVTAAEDHEMKEVEEAIYSELERVQHHLPSPEEMERAKNRTEWRHVRQMANIGGFGGRSNRLNSFNVFAGDPDLANRDVERFMAVQPEDVRRVANIYLKDRHARLVVLPEPRRSHAATSIDRALQPPPAQSRPFLPPVPQRQRLSNGLNLLVLEKRDLPAVAFGLVLKTGATKDPLALPGLAAFTTAMLQEGTTTRSSRQIADEFEFIGSHLAATPGRERTLVAAETLSRHWPKALELTADVIQRPTFPQEEVDRVRNERLTALRRVKDDATALAGRAAPELLYGAESPYGHPLSGYEGTLQAMAREDLMRHFQTNYVPELATLVVVGDASMEEVARLAEEHLGRWKGNRPESEARGEARDGQGPDVTTLYLLDKPGAPQSVIRAGYVGVPRHHPDYLALTLLNHIFGGQFTSRLNMNLRQDKGYSYGYRSWIEWLRRSSLMLAGGAVQADVTREAVEETLKEFQGIVGDRVVTEEEFGASRAAMIRQFPASFETPWQVLEHLTHLVYFDLPDDYYDNHIANLESLSLAQTRQVAREHVKSNGLMVLVVGDRATVEPELRKLGLPLHLIDYEGRMIGG